MEYYFQCPYCWERISMLLDVSVTNQIYVEDCEVCCHPIEVRYTAEEDSITSFEAKVLE
jgi:transcription elongation factor Elf1